MAQRVDVGAIVEVIWADAWFEVDGSDPPWREEFLVRTYGILLRRGAKVLTVASESLPDGQHRAISHIPRALVRRVRYLGEEA